MTKEFFLQDSTTSKSLESCRSVWCTLVEIWPDINLTNLNFVRLDELISWKMKISETKSLATFFHLESQNTEDSRHQSTTLMSTELIQNGILQKFGKTQIQIAQKIVVQLHLPKSRTFNTLEKQVNDNNSTLQLMTFSKDFIFTSEPDYSCRKCCCS